MLLGASAAISAMTGIHVIAATFLLPVGVALYTFVGGIKATFLTDYMHTFIIMIILCYFSVKAWTVPEIGSIGNLYDLVQASSIQNPIATNQHGSYFTMTSKNSILFGILHLCANFGLVIMDTSFFIKAFSASPKAVVPGYVIGGIAYFGIPFAIGTLASSVVLGVENSPIFPTYPRRMSSLEVSNGLVLPYFAITIAGKGGAAGITLITFMAVTSTLSAQVIAVSSIISFDIYRTYFNRAATDKDVIRWSHFGVVFFAIFAAAFSTMLHYVGVDLGWTLYMLGVLTCPGIFPTVFAILWRRQNAAAAIVSPLLGMATGIAVWLGSASALYGEVTILTTGSTLPCVYGTVASAFSPIIYSIVLSIFNPQNFDWADFRNEKLAFDLVKTSDHQGQAVLEDVEVLPENVEQQKELKRWGRISAYWAIATFLGHWVLWPLPMYASKYIFSKAFYSAWLIIAIIWLWCTLLIAGFYPLVDGRDQILAVFRALGQKKQLKTSTESIGSSSVEGVKVDHEKPTL
ncbi:hypothetical protein Vi05172_g5833 [Venturia inaequalis]|nr:hypothetical protein Vi05172_g5833 [Venturia inaequalis]